MLQGKNGLFQKKKLRNAAIRSLASAQHWPDQWEWWRPLYVFPKAEPYKSREHIAVPTMADYYAARGGGFSVVYI